MKQITLNITGMKCMGCVNSVKGILEKFPGIKTVTVELTPPEATISCDDGILPADIISHLESNSHYKAAGKIS